MAVLSGSEAMLQGGSAVDSPIDPPVDAAGQGRPAPSHRRTWTLARWRREATLIRKFAVLSFLVIGLITVALAVTVSSTLRRDLLDREWGTTADYIRTSVLIHLSLRDFLQPDTETAQAHFEALYNQAVLMPEIVRVKLYDTGMRVLWSDEPRLIGQRFEDNPHLARALNGKTVVNLAEESRKEENEYEGNEFARLVEVYVPIVLPGSSRVVGVVETYKMPTQVFAGIRKGQLTVVASTGLGGLLLYLSLFWIVRRASHRIDEQHRSLGRSGRELAQTNQELRTVQRQLLEAERLAAIGEVVTAVAHGIRNPLANIRAAAQVAGLGARGAGPSGVTVKHLANIMSEVDRLERRLRELLQFVRPAERQDALVSLNAVVGEALQMVAGRMTAARVTVRQLLAPDLPSVRGNAMLLEEAVLSLLANSVEAIPNGGGTVIVETGKISSDPNAPAVFLEVRDNGVGIPPEKLPNLFKAFYTTKAQGTGLGLAIAKKFAEAQGGAIAVSSRPGEGATFRITLPAHMEG
jgi:two-component system, NtrC family, sensor histidine kinase HydH